MPTYEETAQKIIKEAIKSAVFIDENAKEPFMTGDFEESVRSEELYKDFKEKSISLDIYKYNDATYPDQKEYLFNNRDLVLLDWKLDGDTGEDKSLSILSEVVRLQPHIHFCVIYTSERKDVVLNNILSYFSCLTKEQYEEIFEEFDDEKETIQEILPDLMSLSQNRFNKERRTEIIKRITSHDGELFKIRLDNDLLSKDVDGVKSLLCCRLIRLGIAFSSYEKAGSTQPCPSDINPEYNTLCINNTLISVFNKQEVEANQIFDAFSQQITDYEKGVMHLLGLEMRNVQRRSASFIDSSILSVRKETLGYHKRQSGSDFSCFVKNVMVEQFKTNISNSGLTILDAIIPVDYHEDPDTKNEFALMNVFYNSQRKNDFKKLLTFGDVFKCGDRFYICITPLCDCAHPEKRDHCFYFAEGYQVTLPTALGKGDSGYISYISLDCYVEWDNVTGEYSHIVPVNYLVPDNQIVNDKLKVSRFRGRKVEECEFEYMTTIRQNYAQRIANHAFAHPVRVGIDFVKLDAAD